jgi:hypothetical protein
MGSLTSHATGDGFTVDGLGFGLRDNSCLLLGFLPLVITAPHFALKNHAKILIFASGYFRPPFGFFDPPLPLWQSGFAPQNLTFF